MDTAQFDHEPRDPNRTLKRLVMATGSLILVAGGGLTWQLAGAESEAATPPASTPGEASTTTTSTTIEVTTTATEPETTTTAPPETTTTVPPETLPPEAPPAVWPEAMPSGLPGYINRGPSDKPLVSITIDDFEGTRDAECINQILDIGLEKGVRFTFFPTGNAINKHADTGVWQRILSEGHEIGNHTFDHTYHMDEWPVDEVRNQMSNTQEALNQALGAEHQMTLMRPPGGYGGSRNNPDPEITQVLQEQAMSLVMWSSDPTSAPFKDLPDREQAYVNAVIAPSGEHAATNGEILLFHCQSFNMQGYLPALIDGLVAKGLTPTTVSGMFR